MKTKTSDKDVTLKFKYLHYFQTCYVLRIKVSKIVYSILLQ